MSGLGHPKQYIPQSKEFSQDTLRSLPSSGVLETSDSWYLGQVVQGKRHGQGVEVYSDGCNYQGHWAADLFEGNGHLHTPQGDHYSGSFVRGQRAGFGSAALVSGEVYEGEWVQGQKQGRGLWEDAKGNSYVGEWRADEADGHGIYIAADGSRYEGEFRNSMKHGQGTEKFAYGDFYVGEFANGRFEGEGEYIWANGNSFLGQFRNGVQHGFGLWKQKLKSSDGETTEGHFLHGLKHGLAFTRFSDGSVFKGYYFKNVRQGYGEMYWAEKKTTYKGQWVDGIQSGLGMLEFEGEPSIYFGLFANGVFVEQIDPGNKPDMYEKLEALRNKMEAELAMFKDEAKRRGRITKILGDTMNSIYDKKLHEIGSKKPARRADDKFHKNDNHGSQNFGGNYKKYDFSEQKQGRVGESSKKRLLAVNSRPREQIAGTPTVERRRLMAPNGRDRSLNLDRSPPRDNSESPIRPTAGPGRNFQFYKGRTTFLDRLISEKLKINHPSLKRGQNPIMRPEPMMRPAWKPSGLNMIQQTPLKYANNIIT